jgi:fatty acid amide hydrolase
MARPARRRPVDARLQDLLMLAGLPNVVRPAVAALMRVQGQPTLARTLASSGKANATRVAGLMRRRDAYRERFAAAMSAAGVDVLICPPCSVPAFRHGSARQLGPASVSYTCLFNLLGYPAGVVSTTTVRDDETAGRPRSRETMFDAARAIDDGSAALPVGVQVAARPGHDTGVLAMMLQLESRSVV